MSLDDTIAVIVEIANGSKMRGMKPTQRQVGALISVFEEFYKESNIGAVFAADSDWFRHEVLEMVFGHRSTKLLDMASVSTLISELGVYEFDTLVLSDNGRAFLHMCSDKLQEMHPTQVEMW